MPCELQEARNFAATLRVNMVQTSIVQARPLQSLWAREFVWLYIATLVAGDETAAGSGRCLAMSEVLSLDSRVFVQLLWEAQGADVVTLVLAQCRCMTLVQSRTRSEAYKSLW